MTLLHYLRRAQGHAYREVIRALDGATEADAAFGRVSDWKRYRYGTGLDGSVEGIVRHLAAWKYVAGEGLETGIFPPCESMHPSSGGWDPLVEWLEEGHRRLAAAVGELTEGGLERPLVLEGEAMTVLDLIGVFSEHDLYHAGQICLLRQQMGHVYPE